MGFTRNARELIEQIRLAGPEELEELERRYGDDPRASVAKAFESARKAQEKLEAERLRISRMYEPIREAGEGAVVVGIDEVGRGPLAGPLTVAAVILPLEPMILGLNDSKKLSEKRREELYPEIRARAKGVGICNVSPHEIDEWGIGACLRRAMLGALEELDIEPDLVLIDGNPMHIHPKERCIVKGDGKVACIAAASIVAKVTRDRIMVEADKRYPGYGFADSKGYGSAKHIEAIKELGLTDFHRKTFCSGFMQESLF
ncbi:MAG: ribonuclease HII [bacterium]|nr:ribonuclease HII [bacterium]